jgi:hypothetical protein
MIGILKRKRKGGKFNRFYGILTMIYLDYWVSELRPSVDYSEHNTTFRKMDVFPS